MSKIYESPDGGITVRARDFGDYENTITITTPTYERTRLIDKYPELKAKWEEYSELEKHYKAWDLLNIKESKV